MYRANKHSGTSLLETMVAVIVLSLGLVGISSTMLTSMRNNDATLSRTQSTMLANEIYEKILANLPAAKAGNYNVSMWAALPQATEHDCVGSSANCSAAQVAEWDLATWGARVRNLMPSSDASVGVNSSGDPMVIYINLRYDGLREIAGFTTESFAFQAR